MRQVRAATRIVLAVGLGIAAAIPPAIVAPAVLAGDHGAIVSAAVHHDVSRPLRHLGPTAPSAANLRERPLRLVGSGANPNTPDAALQGSAGAAAAASPGLGFAWSR